MNRPTARILIAATLFYCLLLGCVSREKAREEGGVLQASEALSIPDADARIMEAAGIVPAEYALDASGPNGWRQYARRVPERSGDLERIISKAHGAIEAMASRLSEISLAEIASSLGRPTRMIVAEEGDHLFFNACYGDVVFHFVDGGERAMEIRIQDYDGAGKPNSPYRYRQSIGIGSSLSEAFVLLGTPSSTQQYGDMPEDLDRVLQRSDTHPGYSFIAYLSEGVRFFAADGRITGIYLFESKAGTERTAASTARPKAREIKPFADVRDRAFDVENAEPSLDEGLLRTLWFSSRIAFPGGSAAFAERVLEAGRDPGLGIRALRDSGLTGEGVYVGIIDQNLPGLGHPEYAGKVAKYRDFGTGQAAGEGSMHGPAVLSLLVGERAGTAPGAIVYFAAAPSWTGDAKYYAEALDWMVDENARLPKARGIRVVSVSAAPSGQGSPFSKNGADWDRAVERAARNGILVLDCTEGKGRIGACYGDPDHPDEFGRCKPGYPGTAGIGGEVKPLLAPTSFRSMAEDYAAGMNSWQYTGRGGLSWGIPWAAGVLAIGWQVDPSLGAEAIMGLLEDSAYRSPDGWKIIDPASFITAVKARMR